MRKGLTSGDEDDQCGAFELELSAALMRSDMIKTRTVILDGRDLWRADLAAMRDAGPVDLIVDLELYEVADGEPIDPVVATTTGCEMLQLLAGLGEDAMLQAG